ncbi:MAG: aldo/keto reductase [Candidatus Bathyarchaeia archaeon]
MKFRKMGSLGWEVSALGFGCMRLPPRRINKLRAETDESVKIIRHGIDLGINYLDSAWVYHLGDSEKILGHALKNGYRERVKVATKLPLFLVRNEGDFDHYLKSSLDRLQIDYLDFYLLHGMDRGGFEKVKRLGLIEKMKEAKQRGLIHHIGFSFHDTLPVFKEIIDYYPWDMTQIQYNYMDTGAQATTEGLKYAYGKGISVVVMEPLKGGKLADPPKEALDIMKKSGIDRTPVDWALRFLWDRPEISTVLSGMGTRKMVDENCAYADSSGVNSLSEAEQKIISEVAGIYREKILVPCTACNYCMPCPSGVDIPGNFALLNNMSTESSGLRRYMLRRKYGGLAKPGGRVDREKPNGNASVCVNCGRCAERCPQHIDIPSELRKTHEILGKGKKIRDFYD